MKSLKSMSSHDANFGITSGIRDYHWTTKLWSTLGFQWSVCILWGHPVYWNAYWAIICKWVAGLGSELYKISECYSRRTSYDLLPWINMSTSLYKIKICLETSVTFRIYEVLDMTMACGSLKSPWWLSGTSTYPSMVTQRSMSWSWRDNSHSFPTMPVGKLWTWNFKVHVMGMDKRPGHVVSPVTDSLSFGFTLIRPIIPEIQLFHKLTKKTPNVKVT